MKSTVPVLALRGGEGLRVGGDLRGGEGLRVGEGRRGEEGSLSSRCSSSSDRLSVSITEGAAVVRFVRLVARPPFAPLSENKFHSETSGQNNQSRANYDKPSFLICTEISCIRLKTKSHKLKVSISRLHVRYVMITVCDDINSDIFWSINNKTIGLTD